MYNVQNVVGVTSYENRARPTYRRKVQISNKLTNNKRNCGERKR